MEEEALSQKVLFQQLYSYTAIQLSSGTKLCVCDVRRAISLRTCFNINRRQDTKHRHVIALYTKDDCFGLVLDSEEELEDWLKALLSLQYGEDAADGEEPKPTFGEWCFWLGSRVHAHVYSF